MKEETLKSLNDFRKERMAEMRDTVSELHETIRELQEQNQSDSCLFGEWASEEGWIFSGDTFWHKENEKYKTTLELLNSQEFLKYKEDRK